MVSHHANTRRKKRGQPGRSEGAEMMTEKVLGIRSAGREIPCGSEIPQVVRSLNRRHKHFLASACAAVSDFGLSAVSRSLPEIRVQRNGCGGPCRPRLPRLH